MRKTLAAEAWLIDGARSAGTPEAVLQQLAEKLLADGLPLARAAVYVHTLHPNVFGRSFTWRLGAPVEVAAVPIGFDKTDVFLASPVARVYATGRGVRRRIGEPDSERDFPVLTELAAEGITDVLVLPLFFSDGQLHAVSWATRAPGGFRDADVEDLEAVTRPLARVAEVWSLRRIAANLLDTYVGPATGARILAGNIRRGDSESIEAVLWFSDLRGFTPMAEHDSPAQLMQVLNRFFDAHVPVIAEAGGETLKFMGDGLLAIFRADTADGVAGACRRAIAAAGKARAALASTAPELGYGLALHLGEVLYGNIGSGDRLDFTCIGPAVNLAARLEKLTARLGRPVLTTAAVARHIDAPLEALGSYELRGIGAPVEVFALP